MTKDTVSFFKQANSISLSITDFVLSMQSILFLADNFKLFDWVYLEKKCC